jgi:hypothetical protein
VWDCGIIVNQRRPLAAGGCKRAAPAMRNRAFRVTPARFPLRATINPLARDQFALVIG